MQVATAVRYWLVMPAAGAGRRLGEPTPKQYIELHGRAVIEWALAPYVRDPRCAGMVVALAPQDPYWPRLASRGLAAVRTVAGGSERAQSVAHALAALEPGAADADWVLVHDAARPCLAAADLDRLLGACAEHPVGGLLAVPLADTLKRAAPDGAVERTVERAGLWRAMTPQMFRYRALSLALREALAAGRLPTDEAQALEWTGARPLLVAGAASNIKITTAEDLRLATALLEGAPRPGSAPSAHQGASR